MPLNIVFAGTPDFAAHHLQALIDSEHTVVGVYTQPDRPAKRGKILQASPVKQKALEHQLSVFQPPNFKQLPDLEVLKSLNADVMVVVAYGLLLPQEVLETPKLGCINVHASLLPRWRGAAPIERAVESGDKESGVTIMQMDIGLDTGDMLVVETCAINDNETGGSLHNKLLGLGCPALLEALHQLEHGLATPVSQDDSAKTYAHKFSKADAAIDWQKTGTELERHIRAFSPFPMAHCGFHNNGQVERLRIWASSVKTDINSGQPGEVLQFNKQGLEVRCGQDSSLLITQLQLPGKKPMLIKDLINGRPDLFTPGQQLS
jgi:methionyl-tRNA formyltransferase